MRGGLYCAREEEGGRRRLGGKISWSECVRRSFQALSTERRGRPVNVCSMECGDVTLIEHNALIFEFVSIPAFSMEEECADFRKHVNFR